LGPLSAQAGPRHGPNLEEARPPTTRSSWNPGFRPWMARRTVRFRAPRPLPLCLVRPTVQAAQSNELRLRLARPTVRAAAHGGRGR
jgi:hypothetical protein